MKIDDPLSLDKDGRRNPPVWVTIGGRLEEGETVLNAAKREAVEETGISDIQVGPIVWYGEQVFERAGKKQFLKESFVLVRSGSTGLSDDHWTEEERSVIADMRWWTVRDMFETDEIILPKVLPERLQDLLTEGFPGQVQPIDL